MYVKIVIWLLIVEIIDITHTTTPGAHNLIQDICDTLYNDNNLKVDEDKQWKSICQELFHSKDNDQDITKQHNIINEGDVSQNKQMRKAGARGSGGTRGGSSRIRGGSIGSGIRTSPSITQYRNSHTGMRISRPNGWLWSRSRVIFLPIATRYFYRSRSSSNRFTTPATSSVTYYYCTPDDSTSMEIQCDNINSDSQCCEDEKTREAFCCGGIIPSHITQDPNRAAKTISRIFYTLAALAFCIYLFMGRFHRE